MQLDAQVFIFYDYICINIIAEHFMGIEKIYIQKIKSQNGGEAEIIELGEHFGFYGMEIPFKMQYDAKEPEKNDWADEDGDDEYIPEGGLKMQAFEIEIKLGYKGDKKTANDKLQGLLEYLTGRDGSGPRMKIYSTYTGIGYNDVRFKSISDDAELVRDDAGDILIIEITLKVNDPITRVVLGQ